MGTCGQIFKSERNLDSHVWFHVGFKPYQCGVCKEGLGWNENMSDQVRVHESEEPYSQSPAKGSPARPSPVQVYGGPVQPLHPRLQPAGQGEPFPTPGPQSQLAERKYIKMLLLIFKGSGIDLTSKVWKALLIGRLLAMKALVLNGSMKASLFIDTELVMGDGPLGI